MYVSIPAGLSLSRSRPKATFSDPPAKLGSSPNNTPTSPSRSLPAKPGYSPVTMASEGRVTVYNLAGKSSLPSNHPAGLTALLANTVPDLKNTSDDAIPNYLNSLGFRQRHRLIDTRLALGYGAFAIAAACFMWDYRLGFEGTKYYTAAAVAAYAMLNGALSWWVSFVEKGAVYEGEAADGSTVSSVLSQLRPLHL